MLTGDGLPSLAELVPSPPILVWDITYACPLRCVHCYSESGRRPSRQLGREDLLRVAGTIAAASPRTVVISGGEPLAVRHLQEVVELLSRQGIEVVLYSSGWHLTRAALNALLPSLARITISLDGATAATHDRIRGRQGSFERALRALALLNDQLSRANASGERAPRLGIDMTVTRSNFDEIPLLCSDVAPRFPRLSEISCAAVIPIGLASRPSFAGELLGEEQEEMLASDDFEAQLHSLAPPGISVRTSNNRNFQLRPDLIAGGADIPPIQIEPDGRARAMPIYEGTVGSLLEEPLDTLWKRAIERWSDPNVTACLDRATSMAAWAEAARRIDWQFGTDDDRRRIAARPVYRPA